MAILNPAFGSGGDAGGGRVDTVVAGTGISVDNTDPVNPIISATGSGTSYTPFWDAAAVYEQGAPVSHRNAPWFRGLDWEVGDEPGKGDNNGWFATDSQPISGAWNGYFRLSQSLLPGAAGFPPSPPASQVYNTGDEFTRGWTSASDGNSINISNAGMNFTGIIEKLVPLDASSALSSNNIYVYIQASTGEEFWLTNVDSGLNVAITGGNVRVRLFNTIFSVIGSSRIKRCFVLDSVGRPIDLDADEVVKRVTSAKDYRNADNVTLSYTFDQTVDILDGSSYNLFNDTDGMFSNLANLTTTNRPWSTMTQKDGDYLRPDEYQQTELPFQHIETELFINLPITISGNQVRGITAEVRRRTAASPTVPVAIPSRGVELPLNANSELIPVQRLVTRSEGAADNYYVYGYAPFVRNDSGNTVRINSGTVVRVEIRNQYDRPILFNNLTI